MSSKTTTSSVQNDIWYNFEHIFTKIKGYA